jgi:HemY protein
LRHQTAARDWDGALRTLSGAADGRILDKRTARRQRAVILTAKAMDLEAGDPDAARPAALDAHELAPDLVPAAVIAGRLLSRQGDIRRAARVLETNWKASPHPEIAEAYLHVRAGDSAGDRLKRAETLLRLRPQADEGRIAVARAAIDARDFDRARDVLTPVLTSRPTQSALFVMADLVETETGDAGRAREWMARAARAPRDPVWTADGTVLEHWAPASPVTGRIDAVEWKVPVAELEAPHLQIDAEDLRSPALSLSAMDADEAVPESEPEDVVAATAPASSAPPTPPSPASVAGPVSAEMAPAAEAQPVASDPDSVTPLSGAAGLTVSAEPAEAPPRPDEAGPALHIVPPAAPEPETEPGPTGLPHMPDDPGVSAEDAPEEKTRRFRLL